ncbi:MAG: hypothetical protein IPK18_05260 [Sphingobacteriales bacterium]|nr:MAG: hypothetical protein IPK18_05260 [Sphingobacteriales bacterium]
MYRHDSIDSYRECIDKFSYRYSDNALGCDSIVTINVTIENGGSKEVVDTAICSGESVSYYGQTFSSTGTYQIVYPSEEGCTDTLVLNVLVNYPVTVTIDTMICLGSTVTVGTSTYNATGVYVDTLASEITGCDSIITTNVIVLEPTASRIDTMLCIGSVVDINGISYTSGGVYEQVLIGSNGCDSILVIDIQELESPEVLVDATICEGEQVEVRGRVYTTTTIGDVFVVPSTIGGCDTVYTVNVIVLEDGDTIEVSRTICEGECVVIDGVNYCGAMDEYIEVDNVECTGMVHLVITETQIDSTEIDSTVCYGSYVNVGGEVYSESGTYTVVTTGSSSCDSVITLNLTVLPELLPTVIDTVICLGETVEIGGYTYNATGVYTQTLTNATGCDSIVEVSVEVLLANDTIEMSEAVCEGDSVAIGGVNYGAGLHYIELSTGTCTGTIALTVTENVSTSSVIDTAAVKE